MENLSDILNKFVINFKRSNRCDKKNKLSINQHLLDEFQENIKTFAKVLKCLFYLKLNPFNIDNNKLLRLVFVWLKNHIKNFSQKQDYELLKKIHDRNNLFVDEEFPPVNKSVYQTTQFKEFLAKNRRLAPNGDVIWKRAKQIRHDAQLISDKNEHKCDCIESNFEWKKCLRPTDLNQGFIGNCWFIAAASGIIENYDLFKKIVPLDNSFLDEDYLG